MGRAPISSVFLMPATHCVVTTACIYMVRGTRCMPCDVFAQTIYIGLHGCTHARARALCWRLITNGTSSACLAVPQKVSNTFLRVGNHCPLGREESNTSLRAGNHCPLGREESNTSLRAGNHCPLGRVEIVWRSWNERSVRRNSPTVSATPTLLNCMLLYCDYYTASPIGDHCIGGPLHSARPSQPGVVLLYNGPVIIA